MPKTFPAGFSGAGGWPCFKQQESLKRPHPNGQYCHKIQTSNYSNFYASDEEKENKQHGVYAQLGELKREIDHLRTIIQRYFESSTDRASATKPHEVANGSECAHTRSTHCVGRNVGDVERLHVAGQSQAVGASNNILQLEGNSNNSVARRDFHRRNTDQNSGKVDLCAERSGDTKHGRHANQSPAFLHQIPHGRGSGRAVPTDVSPHPHAIEHVMDPPTVKRKTYIAAVLESGKPLDGDSNAHQGSFLRGIRNANCNLVGTEDKDVPSEPVSALNVYGGKGRGNTSPGVITNIHKLGHLQPMSRATVTEADSKIRKILGSGYGTHSAKRGAITQLFKQVADGNVRLDEVQHLAKHQSIESLLRYNSDPVTTALALGTQKATRKLHIW